MPLQDLETKMNTDRQCLIYARSVPPRSPHGLRVRLVLQADRKGATPLGYVRIQGKCPW